MIKSCNGLQALCLILSFLDFFFYLFCFYFIFFFFSYIFLLYLVLLQLFFFSVLNSSIAFFAISLTFFSFFNKLFSVFLISSSIIHRLAKPSIKALINLLSFLSANLKIIPYEALLTSNSISHFICFFLKFDIFLYLTFFVIYGLQESVIF